MKLVAHFEARNRLDAGFQFIIAWRRIRWHFFRYDTPPAAAVPRLVHVRPRPYRVTRWSSARLTGVRRTLTLGPLTVTLETTRSALLDEDYEKDDI